MRGSSENRVVFVSILVVAYNPFPEDDVLMTRFVGIIKFGVGRDMADDDAVNSFIDDIFLRRWD